MSGGYFEYQQYHLQDIVDKLREIKVKIENDGEFYQYDRKRRVITRNIKWVRLSKLSRNLYTKT